MAGRWDAPGLGHDGTHEELRRRFEGKAAVVADGPGTAAGLVGERDGQGVAGGVGGGGEDGPGGEGGGGGPREFGEGGGPAAVGAVEVELGVVEIEGGGARGGTGHGGDGDGRGGGAAGELDAAPHLGAVQVDHALRGPDPVVLGSLREFFVAAGGRGDLPLDAREIHAPLGAFGGGVRCDGGRAGRRLKRGPRKGDFEGPAGVGVGRACFRRARNAHIIASFRRFTSVWRRHYETNR